MCQIGFNRGVTQQAVCKEEDKVSSGGSKKKTKKTPHRLPALFPISIKNGNEKGRAIPLAILWWRHYARALCFDSKGTPCYFTLNCNCQQLTSVSERTVMWHDCKINSFLPSLWRTSVMHINIQYCVVRAYGGWHRCTESAVLRLEKDKWLTRDSTGNIDGSESVGHHQWVIGARSTTNQNHPQGLQMKTC